MSADRWSECPLCIKNKAPTRELMEEKYGKIPIEEYEKLQKEVKESYASYGDTPVREDYCIDIDKNGLLNINYSAECMRCRATWSFHQNSIKADNNGQSHEEQEGR